MSDTGANDYNQNVKAAAGLFKEYGDFIYTIIFYKVKDKALAEDLFQDFFLSMVANPPSCDKLNIKGYLYKAIVNDIIDSIRRKDRYQSKLQRYCDKMVNSSPIENPEKELIDKEEMDKVFSVIQRKLQDSEADAVTLKYMKNYTIRDIAAEMSINNTAAWKHVAKGLEKIRLFLKVC
jgi:RNA polymerase sigma factor (sigma-70 family)